MSVKDYANYLQKKVAGLSAVEAQREANRLAPRVNRLLELAALDARLRR
jgi:hypothetical protein